MIIRGLLSTILVILCTGMVAQGEVFRWVDAQGRIHFSDRAPVDAEAKKVDSLATNRTVEPYSHAIDRARLGKYILLHRDGNLSIRLIRETADMLVFDVEYYNISDPYPDVEYEKVTLMLGVTSEALKHRGEYTSLAMKFGHIKDDIGSLTCKISKTKWTPHRLTTDTLHINLFQGKNSREAEGFQLDRDIAFEKEWF